MLRTEILYIKNYSLHFGEFFQNSYEHVDYNNTIQKIFYIL